MAWTNLNFNVGQTLGAAQLNQMQANFTAMAQGLSGAPLIRSQGGLYYSTISSHGIPNATWTELPFSNVSWQTYSFWDSSSAGTFIIPNSDITKVSLRASSWLSVGSAYIITRFKKNGSKDFIGNGIRDSQFRNRQAQLLGNIAFSETATIPVDSGDYFTSEVYQWSNLNGSFQLGNINVGSGYNWMQVEIM